MSQTAINLDDAQQVCKGNSVDSRITVSDMVVVCSRGAASATVDKFYKSNREMRVLLAQMARGDLPAVSDEERQAVRHFRKLSALSPKQARRESGRLARFFRKW